MTNAILVEIALPAVIRAEDEWWIANCPALDVCSQGHSREEALVNLEDAVVFFVESCFERGTLFDVLREAGFERVSEDQLALGNLVQEAGAEAVSVRVPLPFAIGRTPDKATPAQQS